MSGRFSKKQIAAQKKFAAAARRHGGRIPAGSSLKRANAIRKSRGLAPKKRAAKKMSVAGRPRANGKFVRTRTGPTNMPPQYTGGITNTRADPASAGPPQYTGGITQFSAPEYNGGITGKQTASDVSVLPPQYNGGINPTGAVPQWQIDDVNRRMAGGGLQINPVVPNAYDYMGAVTKYNMDILDRRRVGYGAIPYSMQDSRTRVNPAIGRAAAPLPGKLKLKMD
jgi:hypothetical protein